MERLRTHRRVGTGRGRRRGQEAYLRERRLPRRNAGTCTLSHRESACSSVQRPAVQRRGSERKRGPRPLQRPGWAAVAESEESMQNARVFSEEMCARAFDLGTPRGDFVFAGRGQTNPLGVLRLKTDRGAFAIKRFTVPPRPAALAVERAAFAAGIPMPRPIHTPSGEPALTYQTKSRLVWVRAYSWIEGEPGDWGQVSESASFDVGQLMARVHALPVADEVLVEDTWQPPGVAGWRALAEAASTAGHAWAALLSEKIPLLVEAEHDQRASMSDQISPSQRDYHPPNLITPPFGPRVLVDWDAAGAAVARTEAFKFAMIWATPEGERPIRGLVPGVPRWIPCRRRTA